jgi:hypothetical protein
MRIKAAAFVLVFVEFKPLKKDSLPLVKLKQFAVLSPVALSVRVSCESAHFLIIHVQQNQKKFEGVVGKVTLLNESVLLSQDEFFLKQQPLVENFLN